MDELNMTQYRKAVLVALTSVLALGVASRAEAQVFTLPFSAPAVENSVGVYFSDFGALAIEGIARGTVSGPNLGVRGGLVDGGDDTSLTLGGEFRKPLDLGTAPLDISLTGAVQAILGDFDALGLQAGLSLGHTFIGEAEGFRFTPYIHPRIAVADGGGPDGMELKALADAGVEVDFAQNISVRLGVNLGDGADWGLGVAWR